MNNIIRIFTLMVGITVLSPIMVRCMSQHQLNQQLRDQLNLLQKDFDQAGHGTQAFTDKIDTALKLINQGADSGIHSVRGSGIVHFCACNDSYHEQLKKYLTGRPDVHNQAFETPLSMAVCCQAQRNVLWLLEQGAKAKMWRGHDGKTLLWYCKDVAVFKALLKAEVDPNAEVTEQQTQATNQLPNNAQSTSTTNHSIHTFDHLNQQATQEVQKNISTLLGGQQQTIFVHGETILHEMARQGRADLITLLLQYGAQDDVLNKHGNTALQVAQGQAQQDGAADQKKNYEDCIAVFLTPERIKKLEQDLMGLLNVPAFRINWDKVKVIIACGASPNFKDSQGWYLLESAYNWGSGNVDVIDWLIKAGADPKLVDWSGYLIDDKTPIGKLLLVQNIPLNKVNMPPIQPLLLAQPVSAIRLPRIKPLPLPSAVIYQTPPIPQNDFIILPVIFSTGVAVIIGTFSYMLYKQNEHEKKEQKKSEEKKKIDGASAVAKAMADKSADMKADGLKVRRAVRNA